MSRGVLTTSTRATSAFIAPLRRCTPSNCPSYRCLTTNCHTMTRSQQSTWSSPSSTSTPDTLIQRFRKSWEPLQLWASFVSHQRVRDVRRRSSSTESGLRLHFGWRLVAGCTNSIGWASPVGWEDSTLSSAQTGHQSPCTCACGNAVDARGLHGLSCRRSTPRHQISTHKEPTWLIPPNGKRPDGATFISWSRGKDLAWDVTVPDAYAAFSSAINGTWIRQSSKAETKCTNIGLWRHIHIRPHCRQNCRYMRWQT